MWPVFRAMILVVLKNDLELTTMLMLIITICTATSTQTTTPGNFLICYACLSAKHFMWIFSLFFLISLYTECRGLCMLNHVWLCDATDCSPPGSSVYGIFHAGILEWVAVSYNRRFSLLRDQTHVSCISCIGKQILYHWASALNTAIFILQIDKLVYWLVNILVTFWRDS